MMDIKNHGETIVIIGVYRPSDDSEENLKENFHDRSRDVQTQTNIPIRRFLFQGRQKIKIW